MTETSNPPIMPRFAGHVSFFRLPVTDNPSELDIAVCGVPFDGGMTNIVGARHGPRQVREKTHNHIRPVHPAHNTSPFELCRFGDLGDAPIVATDQAASLRHITDYFVRIRSCGAVPISVGGDHLVSLPILRAMAADGPVGLVHFDAHSDTYASIFDGGTGYDNGTPFYHAVEEGLIDPHRTIQIGIRGSRFATNDLDYSINSGMRVVTIDEFFQMGIEKVIAEIHATLGRGPAYVSFDIDSLDASYAPGTAAPEIGGLSPRDAQLLIRGLSGLEIIGCDLVEVCPPLDPSGVTALIAANLLFELADVTARSVKDRMA